MDSSISPDRDEFPSTVCDACHRRRPVFILELQPRCLPCGLHYPPMLRRSFLTALIVGTILTSINQGDHIVNGDLTSELIWKIPLTYCVPFCVATWGALVNSTISGRKAR